MQSIVVSLEMAKKLQAAGWAQGWTGVGTISSFTDKPESMKAGIDGSYFKWFQTPGGNFAVESIYCNWAMIADAPTVEEILRVLPYSIPWKNDSDNVATLFINKFPSSYRVGYSPQWTQDVWSTPDAETLVDAAAACWIYLKENNLLPS